jgi:hypothetical protein
MPGEYEDRVPEEYGRQASQKRPPPNGYDQVASRIRDPKGMRQDYYE